MKCNKKILAVAAAGALTVATAVPALALENEFHGTFTSYYDLSNYSATGNDGSNISNAVGIQKNAPTENYFVQRVRLNYNAKASDQVKLVTKFELDYKFLGNSSYTVGRNSGGGLGADSVNIETKNLYLELSYPALNTKIGMLPYNDSFKGILFDADMAGILLSHDYANASVAAGFFRFGDRGQAFGSDTLLGKNTYDMIALDGKFSVSKEFKVGASFYNINDNRSNGSTTTTTPATGTIIGRNPDGTPVFSPVGFTPAVSTTTPNPDNDVDVSTLGINAEGAVGPLTLNGFAAFQFGEYDDHATVNKKAKGYAFNVGAKLPLMGGTARSEFIYVSGGKNRFFVPQSPAGSEGAALYDAELIMLHRDKNAKTIDTAIVYDVNNIDQGMIMGSIGYDHPCTDKITSSINAGFAAAAKNTGSGTSDYYGTEINLESNYKLNANTTIGIRGGYVFLGDYFNSATTHNADNPYDFKILANYAF
jgi:hypothetical protein